jgi:hypothetical protein
LWFFEVVMTMWNWTSYYIPKYFWYPFTKCAFQTNYISVFTKFISVVRLEIDACKVSLSKTWIEIQLSSSITCNIKNHHQKNCQACFPTVIKVARNQYTMLWLTRYNFELRVLIQTVGIGVLSPLALPYPLICNMHIWHIHSLNIFYKILSNRTNDHLFLIYVS